MQEKYIYKWCLHFFTAKRVSFEIHLHKFELTLSNKEHIYFISLKEYFKAQDLKPNSHVRRLLFFPT